MGPSLPEVWTDVFDRLARKHYPEETENIRREELNEAYRDMLKALRIFYDPWGSSGRSPSEKSTRSATRPISRTGII